MSNGNARDRTVERGTTPEVKQIHKDAEGQFVGTQHGGHNNGVASAKPTVITGSDDATMHKWPPGKKDPPADWDANFDPKDNSGQ
ncbi:hypothetical protein [Rhizobium sp. AAP43]|uniref:hypothetical protein n=1 Tax=Rhizobium sp. AAP43 TaxID=1523420 RepID=UPI000ADA4E1C|nr:hypothetical protein [Rhizobium sp. AAP43]